MIRRPPRSTLFPTRRSSDLAPRVGVAVGRGGDRAPEVLLLEAEVAAVGVVAAAELRHAVGLLEPVGEGLGPHREGTRLDSRHHIMSGAGFWLRVRRVGMGGG